MARVAGHAPVYEAAERWVQRALRIDDSLFTPGQPIWSLENLEDFHARFVGNVDVSGTGFIQKFERQLTGAPSATVQLAAEALYIYYLIVWPGKVPATTKRNRIHKVLAWTSSVLIIPEPLDAALDAGLIDLGPALGQVHASVQVIIEFSQHWKGLSEEQRTDALSDPWAFKDEVNAIDFPYASIQKNALLHLIHPKHFEPISSTRNRQDIEESFTNLLIHRSGDVHRDLLEIRNHLNEIYEPGFHFYDEQIRFVWDTSMPDLERFVRWGSRFAQHPTFAELEINYKVEIASYIQEAKSAIQAGKEDWLTKLKKAIQHPKNNLTIHYSHSRLLDWCSEHSEDAKEALQELWIKQTDIESAIREFSLRLPADAVSGIGTRLRLISFLAMAIDPKKYPIFMATLFQKGYSLTGFEPPAEGADEATTYCNALNLLDAMLEEARAHRLPLQDRLDAQSVLWTVHSDVFKEIVPEVEQHAFVRFREHGAPPPLKLEHALPDQLLSQNRQMNTLHMPSATGGIGLPTYSVAPALPPGMTFDPIARTVSGTPAAAQLATTYTYMAVDEDAQSAELTFSLTVTPETLEALAHRLFWDTDHLRTIQRLLQDKRQVVFYGPPGTGKTYVALELARHFAGADGDTDLVQFHPSYAYEDFVEGFRPADQGGQPGFDLRPGPLKNIAEKARANPGETHVLVIDEINRGNVARVFGELYFLLEYRDREMSLQYSDVPFTLPKNLWFIATMNAADRSIALVDAALRRRFHFVPFFPDQPPVDGLLDRWLEREKPSLQWAADLLKQANAKLADRHLAIGPSHFMRKDLDEEWVTLIWNHSILPYIEEQLFGQEERLSEFDLATLRAEIEPTDAAANGDDDAASPAS